MFKKEPDLEAEYANYIYAKYIYEGMAANDNRTNINALSLCIPTALNQTYQNKILLQLAHVRFRGRYRV